MYIEVEGRGSDQASSGSLLHNAAEYMPSPTGESPDNPQQGMVVSPKESAKILRM